MSAAMNTAAARDEDQVRKEAAAWYARLCSGEATEAEHRAWSRWHQAHPDNQRAWRRIESFAGLVRQVPAAVATPTLRAATQSRRTLLKSVVLLASGGALGWLGYRQAPWPTWQADYRTATGEQRALVLADGSQLRLNTASAVDVVFDGHLRLLQLHAGEILVSTAKGATPDPRPFVVQTAHGRVRALGTRFLVRREAGYTQVSVLEAAVEITHDSSPPRRLQAGEQLRFDGAGIFTSQPADANDAAWSEGSVIADDWPLERLVAELGRYRSGRLACDPAVAQLRVSGAFPVADTERALAVLEKSLPLRVERFTRYWVTLKAARPAG